MLRVFQKLTREEADALILQLEDWFQAHPDRDDCHTDLFVVRRGYIVEDVLKYTKVEE